MKDYTDITVLVDRSGSMKSIRESMEHAYLEFLEGHGANPSTRVTLIQFDSYDTQDVKYQNVPVKSADTLDLVPRGDTPLLDAFCKAIDATGKRLAGLEPKARPARVLFVVITDGQENASKLHTRADVRERVERQTGNYSWQFIYLGANQDAFAEARSFGISAQHTLNYTASDVGVRGMTEGLTTNTVAYASPGGAASSLAFTPEQRDAADEADKIINKKNRDSYFSTT